MQRITSSLDLFEMPSCNENKFIALVKMTKLRAKQYMRNSDQLMMIAEKRIRIVDRRMELKDWPN